MTPPMSAASVEQSGQGLRNSLPGSVGEDPADARPITIGSWRSTFAGGLFKLVIAAVALGLPLIENRPLPLWVGAMLLGGGLAELVVGWTSRHSVVGKVAFGSGAMTAVAGVFFMGAMGMGLPQLTVLTIVWLAVRGLISAVLAFNVQSGRAARTLLFVRGGADLTLAISLVAGVSVAQIAFMLFGGTPAMVIGFLVIVAISFGVAGVGLVAIALAERAWEQRQAASQ